MANNNRGGILSSDWSVLKYQLFKASERTESEADKLLFLASLRAINHLQLQGLKCEKYMRSRPEDREMWKIIENLPISDHVELKKQ